MSIACCNLIVLLVVIVLVVLHVNNYRNIRNRRKQQQQQHNKQSKDGDENEKKEEKCGENFECRFDVNSYKMVYVVNNENYLYKRNALARAHRVSFNNICVLINGILINGLNICIVIDS